MSDHEVENGTAEAFGAPESPLRAVNGSQPVIRFTKNELMELKSLPISNVKPPNFDFFDTLVLDQERSTRKPEKDEEERRPRRRDRDRDKDKEHRGDRGRRQEEESTVKEWDAWRDKESRWGRWHGEQEAQPEWQEEKLPEWDMPVNPDAEGSLTDCTLGDIRKYDGRGKFGAKMPEALEPAPFLFKGAPEEDHQDSLFARWARGNEAKGDEAAPVVTAPVVTAPSPVVAPAPAPKMASAERPLVSPGVLGNADAKAQMKPRPERAAPERAYQTWPEQGAAANSVHTTNQAGRSILSMLKTSKDPPHAQAPPPTHAAHPRSGQHGPPKLTVHDLFQIAQGQQMPQLPAGDDQEKARKAARALYDGSRVAAPERRYDERRPWEEDWSKTYASAMSGRAPYTAPSYARYGEGYDATLAPKAQAPLGHLYSTQGGALPRPDGLQTYQAGVELAGQGRPEGEEDAGCSQS